MCGLRGNGTGVAPKIHARLLLDLIDDVVADELVSARQLVTDGRESRRHRHHTNWEKVGGCRTHRFLCCGQGLSEQQRSGGGGGCPEVKKVAGWGPFPTCGGHSLILPLNCQLGQAISQRLMDVWVGRLGWTPIMSQVCGYTLHGTHLLLWPEIWADQNEHFVTTKRGDGSGSDLPYASPLSGKKAAFCLISKYLVIFKMKRIKRGGNATFYSFKCNELALNEGMWCLRGGYGSILCGGGG